MASERSAENGIAVAKQLAATIQDAGVHDRELVGELLRAQIEGARTSSRGAASNGYRATIAAIVALAVVIVGGLSGFTAMVQSQGQKDLQRVEERFTIELNAHERQQGHTETVEKLAAMEATIGNFNGLKRDIDNLKADYYGMGRRWRTTTGPPDAGGD